MMMKQGNASPELDGKCVNFWVIYISFLVGNCHAPGGGALGYFLGGYVSPGTTNWHPVLKKNFP